MGRLGTVSMQSVRLAGVKLGEHVAVFGQGVFGQFALQVANLDGAVTAIAVDVLDSRLEIARRHGATHVVNPTREDVAERIAAATDGHGVDVAIEATGDQHVINDCLRAAAWLGRVILLGSSRGRVEIDPYTDIHSKGVAVIGAHSDTTAKEGNIYHRWTDGVHRQPGAGAIAPGAFAGGRVGNDAGAGGRGAEHVPGLDEPSGRPSGRDYSNGMMRHKISRLAIRAGSGVRAAGSRLTVRC